MPSAATTRMEIQIPVAWSVVLEDQARLLEVLSLGLEEYRLRQAITLYRSGEFSLAAAAEQAGVPLRVLLEQGRQRGLAPRVNKSQFERDLHA